MALRRHNPVPISMMNTTSGVNTICSVLRDIYWKTTDDEIKLNCRIATSMAKSMSRRLRRYKDEASYSKSKFWDIKENN